MKTDWYTKVILTVIASTLLVIAFKQYQPVKDAKAAGYSMCSGQMTANAYGGEKPMVGGYSISLNCNSN